MHCSEKNQLKHAWPQRTYLIIPNPKQVVKVIRQQAASLPHMDGSIVFVRLRQCAAPIIRAASMGPPDPSPNPKRHVDRFTRFLHRSRQIVVILHSGLLIRNKMLRNSAALWWIQCWVKNTISHYAVQSGIHHVKHFHLGNRQQLLFTARRFASAVLASSYGNSACLSVCPSVRPSVRHTPVLCQNDGT